jgi:predicted nucleotidyltransferase
MISNLSSSEQQALSELKKKLLKKYKVLWMRLFGSKARGDFEKESDLDLAIALENVDWNVERDIYEMCFYVGLEHDLLISPILYSKKEIEDSLTRATPFFKTLEREGIPL